jgi:hypothetical protein
VRSEWSAPADRADVVFSLLYDGRNWDTERLGQRAELAPRGIADAALDTREIRRVYPGIEREGFDGETVAKA